ncbi:unnamed protein product [Oppiella nova]|uniref:Uncharacterized protein n=1 Tax=Oppiella nova TaxID=334625 RepID=A0A7R9QUZ4_9ACAR|nr:unnamed protein product [Oppiella nova]CAG2176532.1 unnamed protein product [Oppiella nova]
MSVEWIVLYSIQPELFTPFILLMDLRLVIRAKANNRPDNCSHNYPNSSDTFANTRTHQTHYIRHYNYSYHSSNYCPNYCLN